MWEMHTWQPCLSWTDRGGRYSHGGMVLGSVDRGGGCSHASIILGGCAEVEDAVIAAWFGVDGQWWGMQP
jgi:hypothetical protein